MDIDIAYFYEEDTGLPGKVRISSAFTNLNPRLKYTIDGVEISVSIEDDPKLLAPKSMKGTIPTNFKGIVDWIKINKAILLEYWDDPTMSTSKLVRALKPVNGIPPNPFKNNLN